MPRTREESIARITKWQKDNPDRVKEYGAKYRLKNKEKLSQYSKDYSRANRAKKTRYMREHRAKLRKEILDAYGNLCSCCGETETVFLEIDHVENNGASERRKLYGAQHLCGGARFYVYIKRLGFPKDKYQILCRNCNWGKHMGVCPHQKLRDGNGSKA